MVKTFLNKVKFFLLLLILGFVMFLGIQNTFKVPEHDLKKLVSLDNDSIVGKIYEANLLTSALKTSQYKSKVLMTESGEKVSLKKISKELFKSIDTFELEAKRSGAAIKGPVQKFETILETENSYILIKTVKVMVVNPSELALKSSEFKQYREKRLGQSKKYVDLNSKDQQIFDSYINNHILKLDKEHPLFVAHSKGKDELLKAINEGYGEFEIEDTFSVAKKSQVVNRKNKMAKSVQNLPFAMYDSFSVPTNIVSVYNPNIKIPLSILTQFMNMEVNTNTNEYIANGTTTAQTEFLAGFTKGRTYDWERKWRFGVGFFRISLGASYGYGLRLPMRFHVTATPTNVYIKNKIDNQVSVTAQIRLEPFDGSTDFYRSIGVNDNQDFSGDEFVLELECYYGMKFNAFGVDWIYIPRTSYGPNYGKSFKPPLGNNKVTLDLFIPPSVTQTEFGTKYLGGFAKFGVALDLSGNARLKTYFNRSANNSAASLYFQNESFQSFSDMLQQITCGPGQEISYLYNLFLENPTYTINAALVPILQGDLFIDIGIFSSRFSTGVIRLEDFIMRVASETYGAHLGTPMFRDIPIGKKTFRMIKE